MRATRVAVRSDRTDDPSIEIGILSELVGYHLRRAGNLASSDFDKAIGELGIRQSLFGILSIIRRNPGINQGMVGQCLGIQRANMVALINELVDRELVTRQTSSWDRRALALDLTDAGVVTYEECVARIRAHEQRLLAALRPGERRELIRLLEKVAASTAPDSA